MELEESVEISESPCPIIHVLDQILHSMYPWKTWKAMLLVESETVEAKGIATIWDNGSQYN